MRITLKMKKILREKMPTLSLCVSGFNLRCLTHPKSHQAHRQTAIGGMKIEVWRGGVDRLSAGVRKGDGFCLSDGFPGKP